MIDIPDEMVYYGEHSFRMQYKDTIGEPFDWLYIDADTLKEKAAKSGYVVDKENMLIMNRPNPNEVFPNPNLPRLCFIKNVVKNPRIIIGDYTYYDDVDGADQFEEHVTHFYDFIGDKLIIGKFCAIAKGVEFVMNGANHRMDCATTYPFYIMGMAMMSGSARTSP